MMEKFYAIFSYVAMAVILLPIIIGLLALLRVSIKENRELDEAIRKRKAEALQKEKAISTFIKAS
jgi:heme exporter protein D